jgi:hypothetical protein
MKDVKEEYLSLTAEESQTLTTNYVKEDYLNPTA